MYVEIRAKSYDVGDAASVYRFDNRHDHSLHSLFGSSDIGRGTALDITKSMYSSLIKAVPFPSLPPARCRNE